MAGVDDDHLLGAGRSARAAARSGEIRPASRPAALAGDRRIGRDAPSPRRSRSDRPPARRRAAAGSGGFTCGVARQVELDPRRAGRVLHRPGLDQAGPRARSCRRRPPRRRQGQQHLAGWRRRPIAACRWRRGQLDDDAGLAGVAAEPDLEHPGLRVCCDHAAVAAAPTAASARRPRSRRRRRPRSHRQPRQTAASPLPNPCRTPDAILADAAVDKPLTSQRGASCHLRTRLSFCGASVAHLAFAPCGRSIACASRAHPRDWPSRRHHRRGSPGDAALPSRRRLFAARARSTWNHHGSPGFRPCRLERTRSLVAARRLGARARAAPCRPPVEPYGCRSARAAEKPFNDQENADRRRPRGRNPRRGGRRLPGSKSSISRSPRSSSSGATSTSPR